MQETVKQDRDKYIGGSDIPTIMNLNPYKSRYDLLLEKAGLKENEFDGNVYTEYGNELEPKIREYINNMQKMKSGLEFKEGMDIREAKEGEPLGIRIHTDGETRDFILEIKTTSHIHENVDEYKIYLVQLLFYMMIEEKAQGLLAVYERPENLSTDFEPHRLQLHSIDINKYKELVEEISRAVETFQEDLIKVRENPFISEEELLPSEISDIASRILAFEYQLSQMKELEAKIKSDKQRLKEAMEAAGVKSWKTPNGYKVTLVPDGEDKVVEEEIFNESRLKSEAPEIYMKFTEKKKVTKKGRAGYVKITAPKGGKDD